MSPVIEFGKGVFDLVPRLVQFVVVFDCPLPILVPGNAWLDFPLIETVVDHVGVVTAVADKTLGQPNHVGGLFIAEVVASIAVGQSKIDGPSLRVRKGVYFGSQPTLAIPMSSSLPVCATMLVEVR